MALLHAHWNRSFWDELARRLDESYEDPAAGSDSDRPRMGSASTSSEVLLLRSFGKYCAVLMPSAPPSCVGLNSVSCSDEKICAMQRALRIAEEITSLELDREGSGIESLSGIDRSI